MNEPITYAEIALHQNLEASEAFAADLTNDMNVLESDLHEIERRAIPSANRSRNIGMKLLAWMNKEQMRFEDFESFFKQHAGHLHKNLTSTSAKKFISAYRKFPDEVTDFKTAMDVLDGHTFFAAGYLEEPKRSAIQTASGKSAYERLMEAFRNERHEIGKFIGLCPLDTWDSTTWTEVAMATKEAAELHIRAEKVIGREV